MSIVHKGIYENLLKINRAAQWIKIDHEEAMVATVYRIIQPDTPPCILKICPSPLDYANEVFCLSHFSDQILVPKIIRAVPPGKDHLGAILMACLPGDLLTPHTITKEIAFEIGQSFAKIHKNKTHGFGYVNSNLQLSPSPMLHFKAKFEEGLAECKGHLPEKTLYQSLDYFNAFAHLLNHVDGPCMIHRDFRPGNMIIQHHALSGIIDWSSARASFAEEDFCSIEHGEFSDFNGYKEHFLEGYSSIRSIPDYASIMPLLRLHRAIAIIGFTVKRNVWHNIHARLYTINKIYLDRFEF